MEPKAERLLNFIKEFHKENGFMPTVREMAVGCGLGSDTSANYWLMKLQAYGKIERQRGKARAMVIK